MGQDGFLLKQTMAEAGEFATYEQVAGYRLDDLCRALLQADPDILEIVQFGSSVYAPDLAHDLDLMVITQTPKDVDLYWDALADWNMDIDLVVREPGQVMDGLLALSVYLWGRTLHGDGLTRKEAQAFMAVPTFDEALRLLELADEDLHLAHRASDEFGRDWRYREAFDALFDAARLAAMAYLGTEETCWGRIRRDLPVPFDARFREIINTLHVRYAYEGEYPHDTADETFSQWRQVVARFIADLAGAREP